MKRYSLLIISISCIIIYLFFNSGKGIVSIEKRDIASGISFDIDKNGPVNEYNVAASVYTFIKPDEISSVVLEGIAKNIPDTRSNRENISSKEFFLGLQKVFIFSEDMAADGFNASVDILLANQELNDSAWVVICKGKALDMLKFKTVDFPTASDHINGMIQSAQQQNFMSVNYKIIDMHVRVNSEGRNLIVPYLDIINNNITITGLAVFKKDKMVLQIPMEEARYLNFLRENKVKGMLTIQNDSHHYISSYGVVKRKVRCEKINGKYKFNIDLEFTGKIVNNTMYMDLMGNTKTLEAYSHELEEETKKKCYKFLNKMQNEYKVDCLELGRDAAATFGRNPQTDWDDVVCKADIVVNVVVKVDNIGRGQFLYQKDKTQK
ncbi:Ger(x)C family spore germination protein [Clostridium lacusfryxellense]|uniref:Ger(x)C family spore germination protein n=1 Tax=Clostridium lacusfryxellense TaxID=205328 RepID=UPI001C0D7F77|nr:Ger(x)C family spore germination protein [Clostridium lacusfryxellense]MBU3114243.1 Ger(x)C family spore germination protein [Clostridium lacusfryxellense]